MIDAAHNKVGGLCESRGCGQHSGRQGANVHGRSFQACASGVTTPACVIFGLQRDSAPSQHGGTFLVSSFAEVGVVLGPTGTDLPAQLPCLPLWCGQTITIQAVVFDPGASEDIAFSRGLELVLGR